MPEITQPPFPQVTAANAAAVLGTVIFSYLYPAAVACKPPASGKLFQVDDYSTAP